MPMKRFGSAKVFASEVIGSVEVFEAKIASPDKCGIALVVASAFTARSSNTASTMRSTPARSAKSAVGRMRESSASFSGWVAWPRPIALVISSSECALPFSAEA